jgi:hypothetical protein
MMQQLVKLHSPGLIFYCNTKPSLLSKYEAGGRYSHAVVVSMKENSYLK